MNIPSKMWHIWIGPNPPPLKWMDTWKLKHPNWEYKIIDNELFNSTKFYNQHLIDEYFSRKIYAGVADLIRYEFLYNYGGFCPPADAICLENTDELWSEPIDYCYTVYESENLRPEYVSPIYACNVKNLFLKEIIDTLNKLSPKELNNEPYKSTGNYFLSKLIKENNPKIKIFPSHYFIPKHFKSKTRYSGLDKVYADQMWGSTKKLYANK
jgi:mannosyltransferase OCH1-like enzyme